MKKYWFIALIALAAGCKTPGHHAALGHRPPDGMSPAIVYYHEASQRLAEARRDGYLNNEQFADMLEKLQGDLRQILMAEAESGRPVHPMPMMQPPMRSDRPMVPMPTRPPRRERDDN